MDRVKRKGETFAQFKARMASKGMSRTKGSFPVDQPDKHDKAHETLHREIAKSYAQHDKSHRSSAAELAKESTEERKLAEIAAIKERDHLNMANAHKTMPKGGRNVKKKGETFAQYKVRVSGKKS